MISILSNVIPTISTLTMTEVTIQIFVGNMVHCNTAFSVHVIENGFIAVQGTKITEIGQRSNLDLYKAKHVAVVFKETVLNEWQILIPGFIDTHIHASQYYNIGIGLNKPLLKWLDDHTFPLEKQFIDIEFARKCYTAVVKKTLTHGTTTASYYATFHTDASLILADIAIQYGQRALIGKVNMTTNAPKDCIETFQSTIDDTKRFIKKMAEKKSSLVKPIITPRFALSLSFDDMSELGKLAKQHDLRIQTHMCENKSEIQEVSRIFKKDYGQVYLETGLLTKKTILAHMVHITQKELDRIVIQKSSVSHCPSSNFNLKSGICDVKRLIESGVNVGLGSDISAGTNVGIIDQMRYAMVASTALSFQKESNNIPYEPINHTDAFYLATLGGAKALSLDNDIGNFENGKEFDALIIDLNIQGGNAEFHAKCTPLELLQKFIYLGDDRNIASVFIAGRQVK